MQRYDDRDNQEGRRNRFGDGNNWGGERWTARDDYMTDNYDRRGESRRDRRFDRDDHSDWVQDDNGLDSGRRMPSRPNYGEHDMDRGHASRGSWSARQDRDGWRDDEGGFDQRGSHYDRYDLGRSAARYGRSGPANYGRDRDDDRDWGDRAADEIKSWFGDDDAEHRRERDHRGRGPANYQRSDERIHDDVNDRLTDDDRVDASAIEVSVAEREVTLSGTVLSKAQKRRAEDCADAVSGVAHVQNNLRVASTTTGASGTLNTGASGTLKDE